MAEECLPGTKDQVRLARNLARKARRKEITLAKEKRDKLAEQRKGYKFFEPTDEQRLKVIMGRSCNLPLKSICEAIINPNTELPICYQTLVDTFPKEIEHGAAMANIEVAQNLFLMSATKAEAAKFWLERRAGWVAVKESEVSSEGGEGKEMTTLEIARRVAFVLAKGARTADKIGLEGNGED